MFVFLSFSSSLKFDYTCTPKHKALPKPDNATLEQVILLTRHGFRAPFDGYGQYKPNGWICESNTSASPRMSTSLTEKYRRYHTIYEPEILAYPPSCRTADLTVEGQDMHEELGKFYRTHLVDELNFLPPYYDPDFMYIRSSEPERCIRSAESFIHGMYPPESPDELLKIITGTDLEEILHPRPDHCDDLTKSYKDWIQSPKYLEKKATAEPLLRKLVEDTGLEWDDWQWLWVGDWLYTIACVGKEIPDFITQEMLDVAINAVEFYTIDFYQHQRGVAGASILREILQHIEAKQAGENNKKFVLLSGHDISIVAALDILGVKINKIPPFASHLAFEIWRMGGRFYVRAVLNGEEMMKPILLSQFKGIVAPYLKYCPEIGGDEMLFI